MSSVTSICVIGGGSWATALVKILSENDTHIHWWMRSEDDIEHLKAYHRNPRYLSTVEINNEKVFPTSNLKEALSSAEYAIIAVPAAFVTHALKTATSEDFVGKKIVSAVKGMIPKENVLISDYIHQKYGVPLENMLAIVGPCHAEEVAQERQSYLTIAGDHLEEAEAFAALMRSHYIKAKPNADLVGVQYCAVIKNIVALACGIARGLNYGDNFQAVLVSNAVQETKRFLDKAFPLPTRDLNGSAYLGDLLVTAYSQFSRNRTFGFMIGKGYSVKSAQIEMNMIAEGYYASRCVYEVNEAYKVNMPVVRAVYHILYERISPAIELRILKDELK
ncbi:MAG: NAD(P)H-dependent glycerol-3-phosphate dehydrogenase [Bernardetiaceae bacterium]|nr:NAD(P)H-dependent glycerol-3-phosphate dehydrogenase [Bernardetiaceae bacterium]